MIIQNEAMILNFEEYGISIPTLTSKKIRPIRELMRDPDLGQIIEYWYIKNINNEITKKDLLRVHSKAFIEKLFSNELRDELIKTFELIDKNGNYRRYDPKKAEKELEGIMDYILAVVSGTYMCTIKALQYGFCYLFGGGMHHAQYDHGKGFCLLNDIVIAARKLQVDENVTKIWIIDVDAHKGDGTAALTKDNENIKTLSIHMANGWPLDEPKQDENGQPNPSYTPSDIDIPIESGEEEFYNIKLEKGLYDLAATGKPGLAIIVSGVDPYEHDELDSTTKINLTAEQLLERDTLIYSFLKNRDIPRAYVMAGGYGKRSWEPVTNFLRWSLKDHYSNIIHADNE